MNIGEVKIEVNVFLTSKLQECSALIPGKEQPVHWIAGWKSRSRSCGENQPSTSQYSKAYTYWTVRLSVLLGYNPCRQLQEQRFFERLLNIHTLEDLNVSTTGGTTNTRGIFSLSPSVLKHGMDYRDHSFSCAGLLLLKVVVFDLVDEVPPIIS